MYLLPPSQEYYHPTRVRVFAEIFKHCVRSPCLRLDEISCGCGRLGELKIEGLLFFLLSYNNIIVLHIVLCVFSIPLGVEPGTWHFSMNEGRIQVARTSQAGPSNT